MIQRLTARVVPKKDWGGEVWFEAPDPLPLLIKFIFTTAKLSVQVHPDDECAQRAGLPRGKTEMWHIIAAAPGAKIAAGFHAPISAERLRASALSGEILDLLQWHDARPGDTFFIPAGTVHAIGEGIALCEIQQYSDVTYRLYDYGRDRPLHLDEGLPISILEPYDVRRNMPRGVLASCKYFTTEKLDIRDRVSRTICPSAEFWVVLDGSGKIAGERFQAGEVWHLTGGDRFEIEGSATCLRASVG
jgi:mannose-6-phosphate isomerase